MILEEIYYAKTEGDKWVKLLVTPEEAEQIKDYLDTIKTPVASGYIALPFEMNRFFPVTYFQAIKFNDNVWDAVLGWRE